MIGSDNLEILFVFTAFLFQIVLIVHFALRKWHFDSAMRYGWIVYALSIPAAVVSVVLLLGDMTWSLWLGGFIYDLNGSYTVAFTISAVAIALSCICLWIAAPRNAVAFRAKFAGKR